MWWPPTLTTSRHRWARSAGLGESVRGNDELVSFYDWPLCSEPVLRDCDAIALDRMQAQRIRRKRWVMLMASTQWTKLDRLRRGHALNDLP